jgi:hypothetical protein
MIKQTLIIKSGSLNHLCTVCVTDNNGAKIALTIIISALAILALGNWAWKKYIANKKEILEQK